MSPGVLAFSWVVLLQTGLPMSAQEPPSSPEGSPERRPGLEEVVVVTPCRGCVTTVINSPAAVSVISSEAIASAPDRTLGELLRTVPGVNVVKTSVRDYNVTPRQGTTTLSNSQLVLVDGRSVYLDFIGATLWDLLPVDSADIDQIEVVRGPASAVWGANAFTGVVNIITKPPRRSPGSNVVMNLGRFNRDEGSRAADGAGTNYGVSTTLSRAATERLAYRVSMGYFASDPLSRPAGVLPLVAHPLVPEGKPVGGGTLPADAEGEAGEFKNRGTTQPRFDLRVDQDAGKSRFVYSAGIAGSAGIVHSGIGPFVLDSSTYLGYARVAYSRDLFHVSAFSNFFGTHGRNLLAYDVNDDPLPLGAQTRSYDLELSHSRLIGSRHILTYGGNLRHDDFRINLAPSAENRTELGVYAQEEFFLTGGEGHSDLRFSVGARVDKFGSIDGLIFSPRLSVIWKPGRNHSVRASFNRAFRAPSAINNYLDTMVVDAIDLEPLFPDLPPEYAPLVLDDFKLQQRVLGNPSLKQESLTSYEVGYIGTVSGRTTLGFNLYVNDTRENINFTLIPPEEDPYTASYPPPGWPLPASYLSDLAAEGTYFGRVRNEFRNLGPLRFKGVELFIEHHFGEGVTGFLNYSSQPPPQPLPAAVPFPSVEITLPPHDRVNAGVSWSGKRFVGSLTMNYADQAFWVDVFPHDFDGYSPSYTMFNASFGVRWAAGKVAATLRGTNLTNVNAQQNVFGDIVKRMVVAEVRLAF